MSVLSFSSINNEDSEERVYKDMIKRLTAQIPEPYGSIPTLIKKKKRKKKDRLKENRMYHIENWIAVDSKESLPDEEDLIQSFHFNNLLSTDFLVLPLHMPPPSLSATSEKDPSGYTLDEDPTSTEDDEDDEDDEDENEEESKLSRGYIPLITKSNEPLTSTTKSYAMPSSPPHEPSRSRWMDTIAQLRRSLTLSMNRDHDGVTEDPYKSPHFIPMPSPPRRLSKKRRSEATAQPRFNPATNTYTRDTRSNSDHLRIISAELNMMRSRKLLSPLKPRGFLPKRTDVFIRGENRISSYLSYEVL
ncbi:hypothetical protein BDB01DRAFT_840709 [Pilobolus umbonatus]|nr:hypothetical protein BDB01DRAFT_840709 [Pilobolus umbonatus]